jgi:hypothetical protein
MLIVKRLIVSLFLVESIVNLKPVKASLFNSSPLKAREIGSADNNSSSKRHTTLSAKRKHIQKQPIYDFPENYLRATNAFSGVKSRGGSDHVDKSGPEEEYRTAIFRTCITVASAGASFLHRVETSLIFIYFFHI